MIAMALALDPQIVIMDEPTTALDVVMQRQILDQLVELRERLGFSVIFITHDLSLLVEFSDRIAIMYGGRIVEEAPAGRRSTATRCTRTATGCCSSFPALRGPRRELTGIPGSPPDLRGDADRLRVPSALPARRSTPAPTEIPVLGTRRHATTRAARSPAGCTRPDRRPSPDRGPDRHHRRPIGSWTPPQPTLDIARRRARR